ncbi:MAG: hypothetical protein WAN93_00265, partial [Solirubrobacteraceae bacterium]
MSQTEQSAAMPAGARDRRAGILRLPVVLLGILVGCMVLASAPAFAGQARLLSGVFGAATSAPADPYPLANAEGVAVDLETHDVYVADSEDHRMEKFDSAGHFILMFGKDVDRTTGANVCTAVSGDVCQAGIADSSAGSFERSPRFIAVDNSRVLGEQGDVYVADQQAEVVSKFDSEGNLISSWGDNGEGHTKDGPANGQLNGANATGALAGPFGQIHGMAVDPSGNLWVNSNGAMFEFRQNSSFITAWKSEEAVFGGIAIDGEGNLYVGQFAEKFKPEGTDLGGVAEFDFLRNLTVDPSSNELYAGGAEHSGNPNLGNYIPLIYRYDSSCHPSNVRPRIFCVPVEVFGANNIHAGSEITGLAVDPF